MEVVGTTQPEGAERFGAPAPTASDAERHGYRAVTFGATDDWAVLDGYGDILFRGGAVHAARVAAQLNGTSA